MRPTAQAVATAATQYILNAAGANLVVDGIPGAKTQAARQSASKEVREFLSHMEARVLAGDRTGRAQAPIVNRQQMRDLVSRIAEANGVPARTALAIAELESRFDPGARSHTGAKGLFQLTSLAVEDVARRGSPRIDVRGNEFNPEMNALAGVAYMKLVASDMGIPLTDIAKVYMGFNIGPTGARQVLAGKAQSVAGLIAKQAYGPPAVYEANLRKAVAKAAV